MGFDGRTDDCSLEPGPPLHLGRLVIFLGEYSAAGLKQHDLADFVVMARVDPSPRSRLPPSLLGRLRVDAEALLAPPTLYPGGERRNCLFEF